MTKEDKVAKCIKNGDWNWPQDRKLIAEAAFLKQVTPSKLLPISGTKDHVVSKGCKIGVFTVKTAMKLFNGNEDKVEWYKLVWGKGACPKILIYSLASLQKEADY